MTATPYLITRADFAQYQDLAANVPAARLNSFILDAQNFDMKPFLGLPMYQAMLRGVTNDPVTGAPVFPAAYLQPYLDLINGVTYTDRLGNPIDSPGVKPMLVYFALSRMAQWGNYTFSATGIIKKKHEEADALSGKEISIMVDEHRSKGKSVENEVKMFLLTKQASYPLYFVNDKGDRQRGSGARISGIDRSDFNSPNGTDYGQQNNNWFTQY